MKGKAFLKQLSPVQRFLLVIAGSLSLILGIIGIILPLLPTTPFLLLASYCYLRSSKRLYLWLINHRLLGSYIYNYMHYRAVSMKAKVFALILLWATLLFSIWLIGKLYLGLLLGAVGIGVSIHLLTLKTLTNEQRLKRYGELTEALEEEPNALPPERQLGNRGLK
ncbi:MAG: YbaN family protein [Spirochaetota bacterium]